jgi:hypothetical protein
MKDEPKAGELIEEALAKKSIAHRRRCGSGVLRG